MTEEDDRELDRRLKADLGCGTTVDFVPNEAGSFTEIVCGGVVVGFHGDVGVCSHCADKLKLKGFDVTLKGTF